MPGCLRAKENDHDQRERVLMLTVFGIPLGTLSQFGTFVGVLAIVAGMVTVWIRGIPERRRVENEARAMDIDEAEKIRTDYAQQIRDFRKEVHGYRNDLQNMEARLSQSESTSRRRSDVIKDMMFIIRLLISELKRTEPQSIIVGQAEAMLARMDVPGVETGDPLSKAKETEACAHATVKTIEAGGGK
jgi:hypothetical protein